MDVDNAKYCIIPARVLITGKRFRIICVAGSSNKNTLKFRETKKKFMLNSQPWRVLLAVLDVCPNRSELEFDFVWPAEIGVIVLKAELLLLVLVNLSEKF